MAEAILNRLAAGRICAYSAGSHPKDRPHPMALETLREHGYDTAGLRSKSWREFAQPGAPILDFVFTVCANAAGETCPLWPGQPITAHWDVEDPAAFEGPENEQRARFRRIYLQLERNIDLLAKLNLESLGRSDLRSRLEGIGETEPPSTEGTR